MRRYPAARSMLDPLGELLERILDADRDARFDRGRVPPSRTCKRHALPAGAQIPGGHLDRRLGHVVAPHDAQGRKDSRGCSNARPSDERREEVLDDVPRRRGCFSAVERIGVGHAFAEALRRRRSSRVTRTNVRSYTRPKLVSKKRTSGRRISRSSSRSIVNAVDTLIAYTPPTRGVPSSGHRRARRRRQVRAGRSSRHAARWQRSFSTTPTTRSSPISTPDGPAPPSRPSSSSRSRAIVSRRSCGSPISSARRTVCDYLFERDKIYAYLNLDDNELFVYQRLYDLLAQDVPAPDLVIYLQTPTDVLRKRLASARAPTRTARCWTTTTCSELNEAYNHFFFHYTATPLLVVETSQLDLSWGDEALDDLVKQLDGMGHGTRYYVPRTK